MKWINDAFRNYEDNGQNKLVYEVGKRMKERREIALKECKQLMKELLKSLTRSMQSRIESL